LFLESLETRKLMAADLDASATQDLLLRSLNPVQGASQPTANFSSFNSDRIIALDADSLNPRQASLIDNASRLSKVDYAPSSYLNQFRNQVPSQGQLQGSLIGSSTNPRLELNTTSDSSATTSSTTLDANTAEAGSIANGSFFSGLFTQGGRTANTRVLTAAQPLQVQWVGAFCDVDGTEVFPLSQSSNVVMSRLPEGEGDDDDDESIVPEVDFPTLESSSHIGEFDLFLPPSPSSSSSLTTFGAFTAASLTNPDLTLPGLNWVHLVDVYWVSPTQWSFTESLVLSFDLGNSVEDEGQESIVNGQGSNEDGPDGDDSSGDPDDDEDTGLDVESEWESSIGASRSGYFKFTFSASRGITTASAAGVRWSLLVDYLDSASVSAEASGRADFTPSDPSTNDDGGSSNGDDDELEAGGIEGGTGRDVIDTPQYPDDFTATSKWKASARISVETSGVIIVSSTPAIASDGEIDRTIAASITYDVDGDIEVSEEWSSSSQSGDISLVDFPVEDGDHPLGGCGTEIFDNGDAPGDGDNGEGEGGSGARGGRDPGTDPIGEVEGKGHASMSSGKSLNKAGGGLNGSFGLNGVLRNGRFSSLIGNALSDLETARENSGDGDHLFVFRDHKVTPVEYGQTVTTIVLKAGWTGIGKGDGSADGDGDTELGLNSEGVPAAIDESTGTAEGDADGNLRDFVNLSFVETTTKTWNLSAEGLYGPIHNVGSSTDSFELTYKSKSKGKSIGDVYGLASLEDRSADFESDLTGDGTSLLLVVESHILDSDIDWINYSGPTLTHVDEQFSQREEYFSKYDIAGNATGVKNDDGSVTWTLDAEIRDYLDVDYDYSSLYTTKETHALDSFSRRIANFDAAKMTRSTLVGGGTISPHPGGDTGGLTATDSKGRSGDTEVSIVFSQTDTGEAATGLEVPVEKTRLELELEAMFADYDEGDYSGDASGGDSDSGQSSSGDDGNENSRGDDGANDQELGRMPWGASCTAGQHNPRRYDVNLVPDIWQRRWEELPSEYWHDPEYLVNLAFQDARDSICQVELTIGRPDYHNPPPPGTRPPVGGSIGPIGIRAIRAITTGARVASAATAPVKVGGLGYPGSMATAPVRGVAQVLESSASSWKKHGARLYADLKNVFKLDVSFVAKSADVAKLVAAEYQKLIQSGVLKYKGLVYDVHGSFHVYEHGGNLYLFGKDGGLISRMAPS
jgi:hypothetical protein